MFKLITLGCFRIKKLIQFVNSQCVFGVYLQYIQIIIFGTTVDSGILFFEQ